jgi:pimeloyl-ACP methyl ester carboxylesterase
MNPALSLQCEDLGYQLFVPPRIAHSHLLVVVHGVQSSAATMIQRFTPMAKRFGVVLLAPDFTGTSYRGYQRLSGKGSLDAAAALDRVVHVEAQRLRLDPHACDLFGFSGGGQFAHRYAMTRPERVRRLIVGAAGWYSECDAELPFPEGMGGKASAETLRRFLAVPVIVAVGAEDTARDRNLRRSVALDRRQGRSRLERARFWHLHLEEAAIQHGVSGNFTLKILPQTGHRFRDAIDRGGLTEIVAEALGCLPDNDGPVLITQQAGIAPRQEPAGL